MWHIYALNGLKHRWSNLLTVCAVFFIIPDVQHFAEQLFLNVP